MLDGGARAPAGIGGAPARPDGADKVRGRFRYAGDLDAPGALVGHTVRSPHAAARIRSIDIGPALARPGVHAVLVAADVPGRPTFGTFAADQPVFASDVVRYQGEPVAAVAAADPATAREAAAAIVVAYEPTAPLTDPGLAATAEPLHPAGNVYRRLMIRRGDPSAHGAVVVEGTYEVGVQDQVMLAPEAGLAIPDERGGVDLFIATQSLHGDQEQLAACLGLPPEQVRITLAGVGGAFGGREDLSLHVHACLLALRTGRPVRMAYTRRESFLGHPHRHPARLWYRHEADRDGALVRVDARLLLDGGAYQSSSTAVLANAASFAVGPYRVPNAQVEGLVVRTNNPPNGAMRGFGAVQVAIAAEAQMDRLAERLLMDPVALRRRNALGSGDELITGQRIHGTAPVVELLDAIAAHPLPPVAPGGPDGGPVRRGVGYAVGFKNLMYSEGVDDSSTAACRLDGGTVTISCAAAEVGQGFVTLVRQIVHDVLAIDDVVLAPASTTAGSAGSTSASRQTWMSGGAVRAACEAVRVRREAGEEGAIVEERTFRHPRTTALDADGQGDAHVAFAFVAHRAVVDVDVELGVVRIVDITTAQDVGRALHPLQVIGQIEGGTLQGVGLALMEELRFDAGCLVNGSLREYLIPTALDAPPVRIAALIELPEPGAPHGAKGVGEAPAISSTPAVAAAVRDATGLALRRLPIRAEDIALGARGSVATVNGGWRRNGDVLATRLDDEIVLLHPTSQQMFTLNETGVVLWDQIEAGADLDGIVGAITSTFEVDDAVARADVADLLEQLAGADLIHAS